MEDANEAAQQLLASLEARHSAVLDELDALDAKIESVIESYQQSRKPELLTADLTDSLASNATPAADPEDDTDPARASEGAAEMGAEFADSERSAAAA